VIEKVRLRTRMCAAFTHQSVATSGKSVAPTAVIHVQRNGFVPASSGKRERSSLVFFETRTGTAGLLPG